MEKIKITPATSADEERIWALLQPVFSAGDTYAVDPLIDREAAIAYWMEADKTAFILRIEGQAVGTYYIRPNQPGAARISAIAALLRRPRRAEKGLRVACSTMR